MFPPFLKYSFDVSVSVVLFVCKYKIALLADPTIEVVPLPSEFKYISKRFLHKNHFWKATNEPSSHGEDFIVIERVGCMSELEDMQPNQVVCSKISIAKAKIRDKLI